MTELIPAKATFAPDDEVAVEVRGDGRRVTLTQLGAVVAESDAIDGWARFGTLAPGGYGVHCAQAHSALDVLSDPFSRPRYGFVSHYEARRDPAGVTENARRLHLNAVQFYDWMYRHARLLPPQDGFTDALGQTLSLDTVRRLARELRHAGSLPLGYAAVYAVGKDDWPEWEAEGLYHADGEPWTLGDFLWIVDPSSERWLDHFVGDLQTALELGFAGFHLDQYGAPKAAVRRDGRVVRLERAFPALIERVHADAPEARLVFNNVNDFPTWTTARAPVDAVYFEVWPPHDRLGQLGTLITRARSFAPDKPVIVAAYLEQYAESDTSGRAAERLQLATVFSHGGTSLLHGEEHAVLIDPYYVRHAEQSPESYESTRRFYDFAVRHGDLLFDSAAVEVTGSLACGVNQEIFVEAGVPVGVECAPGALWLRVVRGSRGLLVHLIDLTGQEDDRWSSAKRAGAPVTGVRLRVERAGAPVEIAFADPDRQPVLAPLAVTLDERHAVVELPSFETWGMVWIKETEEV
ncbi:MAG TPA: glycoside hydrolase family 66 protein [Gaiellaceae bacterium]|nr:glycoside hydrolase family 66 protein [Gaiellaceae bacterium]